VSRTRSPDWRSRWGRLCCERFGRTLRMTHAGVAFKHHVDALLHELDDGLAAVHEMALLR